MDVTTKIITQFVKDLSFENPKGPSGFQSKDQRPQINAQVDVKAANQKNTNVYEVELNINVSATRLEEKIYITTTLEGGRAVCSVLRNKDLWSVERLQDLHAKISPQ